MLFACLLPLCLCVLFRWFQFSPLSRYASYLWLSHSLSPFLSLGSSLSLSLLVSFSSSLFLSFIVMSVCLSDLWLFLSSQFLFFCPFSFSSASSLLLCLFCFISLTSPPFLLQLLCVSLVAMCLFLCCAFVHVVCQILFSSFWLFTLIFDVGEFPIHAGQTR